MATVNRSSHASATPHVNGDGPNGSKISNSASAQIIDIRRDREQLSLIEEIRKGLRPENGEPKTLPTLLLYDEKGLKLFEDITYLDQYYLTNAEIELLERHAQDIASHLKSGSVLIELGSG